MSLGDYAKSFITYSCNISVFFREHCQLSERIRCNTKMDVKNYRFTNLTEKFNLSLSENVIGLRCMPIRNTCACLCHNLHHNSSRLNSSSAKFMMRVYYFENSHIHIAHCLKKQDTRLLPITSPNVNRFSKFFHWQTHW